MDLIFAVDSIPAVFAITTDQFIIYTSNICAILGLRSLYFLLARMIDRFIYLKTGLALILGFVGNKNDRGPSVPHPKLDFASHYTCDPDGHDHGLPGRNETAELSSATGVVAAIAHPGAVRNPVIAARTIRAPAI